MKQNLSLALLALVFGFVGAALWSLSGIGNGLTRNYLVENPDILPQMAEAFERQQSEERLSRVSGEVTDPFPGAVLGNPEGTKTLVKFTDYGCGYCRASVADVEKLVAADPDLRVVIREWPIFDGSEGAARMALAAARQGKYQAFHKAMFAMGPPSPESVDKAASAAGLDMDRARADAASDAVTEELAGNMALARAIGFGGTPSWVAGDAVLEGAVGYEALAEALAEEG